MKRTDLDELEDIAVGCHEHIKDQGAYACIQDDAPEILRQAIAELRALRKVAEEAYRNAPVRECFKRFDALLAYDEQFGDESC